MQQPQDTLTPFQDNTSGARPPDDRLQERYPSLSRPMVAMAALVCLLSTWQFMEIAAETPKPAASGVVIAVGADWPQVGGNLHLQAPPGRVDRYIQLKNEADAATIGIYLKAAGDLDVPIPRGRWAATIYSGTHWYGLESRFGVDTVKLDGPVFDFDGPMGRGYHLSFGPTRLP